MKKRRTSKGKGRRTAVWLGLAVLLAAAGWLRLQGKKELWKRSIVKVWLIGFAADFAGAALMRPATDSVYRQMYPRKYSHYIEQYSREYGVDKNLVYAVTRIESNFDPQAVSSADARGLMQMTSDAFDWVQYRMGDDSGVSYEQIFEPKVAIQYGTYMLHLLLEEMGDEKLAICAYHAGMSNVRSWLSQENYSKDGKTLDKIPYSDTEWYYDKVSQAKQIYEELYS